MVPGEPFRPGRPGEEKKRGRRTERINVHVLHHESAHKTLLVQCHLTSKPLGSFISIVTRVTSVPFETGTAVEASVTLCS